MNDQIAPHTISAWSEFAKAFILMLIMFFYDKNCLSDDDGV